MEGKNVVTIDEEEENDQILSLSSHQSFSVHTRFLKMFHVKNT
jgi:hypothetical protein